MKIHKKQCVKVADNKKKVPARLSHTNKGFALVCSLLREVWEKNEANGPRVALAGSS